MVAPIMLAAKGMADSRAGLDVSQLLRRKVVLNAPLVCRSEVGQKPKFGGRNLVVICSPGPEMDMESPAISNLPTGCTLKSLGKLRIRNPVSWERGSPLTRRLEGSGRCSTPRLAYQANKVLNERVQWIGFAPGQADFPFGFIQSRIQQADIWHVHQICRTRH
jgi:hypothetical protein